MCCTCNPHKSNILSHLIPLGETLDIQMSKYGNFLIVGDFNSELSESVMSTFFETFHVHSLVTCPTSFKNPKAVPCVKSVRIRSYSGPHFSAFGLNTERYSVSPRIQSECEKMRSRITPNTDTFYAVVTYTDYKKLRIPK